MRACQMCRPPWPSRQRNETAERKEHVCPIDYRRPDAAPRGIGGRARLSLVRAAGLRVCRGQARGARSGSVRARSGRRCRLRPASLLSRPKWPRTPGSTQVLRAFFFVVQQVAVPRSTERSRSLTTWIANVPGREARRRAGCRLPALRAPRPGRMRAWCLTAARESATLEVRIRIPAPAPFVNASRCVSSSTAVRSRMGGPCVDRETGWARLPVMQESIGPLLDGDQLDAPGFGPCTRVQPCLASTAGGERYSDGPPT